MKSQAKVTLVGAGPGDPELISIKGLKAIQNADAILYDALVHPNLLNEKPKHCKTLFVGKRAGKHKTSQEEINRLLVEYAYNYGHVVRLKGGDPFVFARGKEEIDHVEAFNIPTQVIPGISSVNVPGTYGIPLTVRGINESYWVVTGTTSTGELSKDVHLVAQSNATAVILMGSRKLEQIVEIFQSNNKGNVPMAIISKGSLPDNQILFGRINTILEQKKENKIEMPAIIVIGEAIGTHPHFYEEVHQAIGAFQQNQL